MESETEVVTAPIDPIEGEVDEALRLTGGDARTTVRALIFG